MFANEIGIIVWKKNEKSSPEMQVIGQHKYHCITNNCKIKNGTELDSYTKNVTYGDRYNEIISTNEDQLIDNLNNKILLKYIPEDTILELCIPKYVSVHLLSTISHKIRIPLTNIFGILKLIDKTKLNKTEKENMDILKKSCYEIINVANDIIDIVNSKAGKYILKQEKINLNSLLYECKNIVTNDIIRKNIFLKIIVEKNIPNNLVVDPTKLKQIIINLLNNSIQHTNIGSIIISVSLYDETNNYGCPFGYVYCQKPKYNILFCVKDTGSGMEDSNIKYVSSILGINKIIDNSNNYCGFGLIISKYICNLMGGNIWFKTDNNIGTAFYFNILVDGVDN